MATPSGGVVAAADSGQPSAPGLSRQQRCNLPLLNVAVWWILLGLGAAFVLLVGLRVHGFSLPVWHGIIDGSEPTEVLAGTPRYIRADDWLVQLPAAYAQAAHDPPFPVVNENIGTGQNMLMPVVSAVAHPVMFFRPTQWGFFLGNDVGTAWLWWSQVLGLGGVWLLVLCVVTRGRVALSAAGALLILVSPFFQFWAFTKSTIAIYMGMCFLATVGLASARTRRGIAANALVLGWAGAAFGLVLYPAFQIVLFYLYAVLVAGWLLDRRRDPPWRIQLGERAVAALCAALIAGGIVAAYFLDARETVALLLGTAYPGARISTGGDAATWQLFTAHLASPLQVSDLRNLDNIVEASSFWLLFPVVGVTLLWKRARDPLAIALLLYCVAIALYREIGIPELLSRASLFFFVPGRRALIGLGLADVLLVARYLAAGPDPTRADRRGALAVALAWTLAVILAGLVLQRVLPGMTIAGIGACSLVNGGAVYLVVLRWRPAVLTAGLAAVLAVTCLWFNPWVVGGSQYLASNPLSSQILAIDREHGGDSTWLAYGNSDLPNLFRTIGVRAFGGNLAVPQFALWEQLDPEGASRPIYNRYAHVGFRYPKVRGAAARFRLSSHHGFWVEIDPEGAEIAELGVTHLLVRLRTSSQRYWEQFEPRFERGRHAIFDLPLRPRSSSAPEPAIER